MFTLIVRRLLGAIPLLFLLTLITFGLLHALPGDPAEVLLGTAEKDLSPQDLQVIRHDLGIDRSLPEQYVAWLQQLSKGNLGRSYRDGRAVSSIISERLGATMALVGTSLVLALGFGLIWGIAIIWLGETRFGKRFSGLLASAALILYCLPSFWLAFLLIGLVSGMRISQAEILGLHAPGSAGIALSNLILPAIILAGRRMAKFALLMQTTMQAELAKEYVRTAYLKGVPRLTVLVKHVGRNSIGPVIALLGLSVPALIGGSVLVETVFAYPGMGRLAVDATFGRNFPILLALTLVYGTLVILANLAADLLQHVADPRIAFGDQATASKQARG